MPVRPHGREGAFDDSVLSTTARVDIDGVWRRFFRTVSPAEQSESVGGFNHKAIDSPARRIEFRES